MARMKRERSFSEILEKLQTIARASNKREAAELNGLIERLQAFKSVVDDVEQLRFHLQNWDEELERFLPLMSQGENVELHLAILALVAVQQFLIIRAPSKAIDLLRGGLAQVMAGSLPLMFRSKKGSGRPTESALIHQVKGVIAGLTRVKQDSGMRRNEAAAWIARNMPPELASRITAKPITTRTVIEWADRYGGKHPPPDPGGRAFHLWKRPLGGPLTVEKFKEMMRRIVELLPARH
jgi:hypothetical protein